MSLKKIGLSLVAAFGLSAGMAVLAFAGEAKTEATDQVASEILFTGTWEKKSFKVAGTWEIYEANGKQFVKLSSDFKTRKAPDLKIFLSPLTAAQTSGRNATDSSVLISPLSSNKGAQVYEIPAGVNIADFKSIVIHCEQFSKLWSAADLKVTS